MGADRRARGEAQQEREGRCEKSGGSGRLLVPAGGTGLGAGSGPFPSPGCRPRPARTTRRGPAGWSPRAPNEARRLPGLAVHVLGAEEGERLSPAGPRRLACAQRLANARERRVPPGSAQRPLGPPGRRAAETPFVRALAPSPKERTYSPASRRLPRSAPPPATYFRLKSAAMSSWAAPGPKTKPEPR